jgi:hypothetical protein
MAIIKPASVLKASVLKVAYQPFLSSTRTKQLTSILQSSIPYCNFLPIKNTSLNFPQEAQIVLISRGGKPFAPVYQRPSVDFPEYPDLANDLNESYETYQQHLTRWEEVQERFPLVLKELKRHFSDSVITNETFEKSLEDLSTTGEINNVDLDSIRETITSFHTLRTDLESLPYILERTQAASKVNAVQVFGSKTIRDREYLIERYRDHLDVARKNLEDRYQGMGMVTYPEDIGRPWILMPADPISAWANDFSYRVEKLIQAAQRRFLFTSDEREAALDEEAKGILMENRREISRSVQQIGDSELNAQDVLDMIKVELRDKKAK